jgi:putative colanic acid biosynthesis UDP-glucose lipid carrier transferase
MRDSIIHASSRFEFSMRLLDILALFIAGQLSGMIRFNTLLVKTEPIHAVLLYFCCGLAFLIFPQFDLYLSWRGRSLLRMLLQFSLSWALVLSIGIIFSFLIHDAGGLSRIWIISWFLSGLLLLMFFRATEYFILNYLRKKGFNKKYVLIVGYGPIGREMHRRALQNKWYGYEVKAIQADAADVGAMDDPSIVRISDITHVPAYLTDNDIHEIWISLPIDSSSALNELHYLLRNALVDIRWIPDILSMRIISNRMAEFLGFPTVELNRPISRGMSGVLKLLFDKIFSATVLILLAPLFLVIAAGIKYSSSGPVFFKQPRLGLNGKKFNIYKFRSMEVHQENGSLTQATSNDSRTFKIGKFIRRTSLDELPQFINVLLGDMSVVGPRPHALQHNDMYKGLLDLYMLRHRVTPGITGWAQIHGYRGETDTVDKMEKRVQFDLYYIQNWSLWMDFKIIVWTAFKGWTGGNAY